MCVCQIDDRREVVLDLVEGDGTGISCDVVRACEYDKHLWLKSDNVLPKAHQQVGRSLRADTAIEVRLSRKINRQIPAVGDRVSQKNNPWFTWFGGLNTT